MSNFKPIPVTDTAAIDELLAAVQGRGSTSVYESRDITRITEEVERRLRGLPNKFRAGIKVLAHSPGGKHGGWSVKVTFIELRMVNGEWRLTDAYRKQWSKGEEVEVTLDKRHDYRDVMNALAKRDGITVAAAA